MDLATYVGDDRFLNNYKPYTAGGKVIKVEVGYAAEKLGGLSRKPHPFRGFFLTPAEA